MTSYVREDHGHCPVCERDTVFRAYTDDLRNSYICVKCHSLARHRAFVLIVKRLYPGWTGLRVHEANPGVGTAVAAFFAGRAGAYTRSRYDPSLRPGQRPDDADWQHEDLERQTFADESFDLVLTQDVFEHVFDPMAAAAEIARTLSPGGAHVCTVPLVRGRQPSRRRAGLRDGEVVHHLPPEYHGNPIDPSGSLVTIDWGYDIANAFDEGTGLSSTIFAIQDPRHGIMGRLAEVIVSVKGGVPQL